MTDSEQLAEIKALINHLVVDFEGIRSDVEGLKQETAKTNERVEAYQKDSQQSEIKALINHLTEDVESLKQETARTNDRVETYQKSSQQVVNLAFSLILAATAAIVIPTVLGR
jgi:outer membrane murein-binding lipoprotein Lpp